MSLKFNTDGNNISISGYGKTVEIDLTVSEAGIKGIYSADWLGSRDLLMGDWPNQAKTGVVRARRGTTRTFGKYDAAGRKQSIATQEVDFPINSYDMAQWEIETFTMSQLVQAFKDNEGDDLSNMVYSIITDSYQKSLEINLDVKAMRIYVNECILSGNITTYKEGDSSGFDAPANFNETFLTYQTLAFLGADIISTYSQLALGLSESDIKYMLDAKSYINIRTGALAPGSNLALQKLESKKPTSKVGCKLDGYTFLRNGTLGQNIVDRNIIHCDEGAMFSGVKYIISTPKSLSFPNLVNSIGTIKSFTNLNPVFTSKIQYGGALIYPEFSFIIVKGVEDNSGGIPLDGRNLSITEALAKTPTAFSFTTDPTNAGKVQTTLPVEPLRNTHVFSTQELAETILPIDNVGNGTTSRFFIVRAYDITNDKSLSEILNTTRKSTALSVGFITGDGNLPSANVLAQINSLVKTEVLKADLTNVWNTLAIKNLVQNSKVLIALEMIDSYEPVEFPKTETQIVSSVLDAITVSVGTA